MRNFMPCHMQTKKQINNLDDIKLLVDTFYNAVKEDELIGPVFNERIKDNWPRHLETMYSFWQSILLNEPTYNGRPFPKHMEMPIDLQHFKRWVELFCQTVDELFEGDKALDAKGRAQQLAITFYSKMESLRGSGSGNSLL